MKLVNAVLIVDVLIWAVADADVDGVSEWFQSVMSSKSFQTSELQSKVQHRSKRSLANFGNVIQCVQPWSDVLSTYGDYGCYCGYRGHGRPIDDTDKCCYVHDRCYEEADKLAATEGGASWFFGSYFSGYQYDCIDSKIVCYDHSNSAYAQALCECDKAAAECFAASRNTYSRNLYNIDTDKYCGDDPDYEGLHLESHTLSKFYTCARNYTQDKCCVDKGYNSAVQFCCGDTIRSIPGSNPSVVGCCDDKLYDTRVRMCCYGVLYPKAKHLQCCGDFGEAVDRRLGRCVNGTIVLHARSPAAVNTTTSGPGEIS